jgi:hypothetical protein
MREQRQDSAPILYSPMHAWLVLLGKNAEMAGEGLLLEPPGLAAGESLPLELRHYERWRRQDVTRVIIGSEPTWADLVLVDQPLTIRREHARFYLNHQSPERSDFRAMKQCPVFINGRLHPPLEWVNLSNGDEIQLSCWRFRYEWEG